MSLYFVFSIDGDWGEYFSSKLSTAERQPDKKTLMNLIQREMRMAVSVNGKLLHFIHTSPVTRDFFVQPEFISLWKKIQTGGGSVGVHCHHESLSDQGNFDREKVDQLISSLTGELQRQGLGPISYRGGYLAFSEKHIPILEKNGLRLDFSCETDRHLFHGERLVADWRGAPRNYYRMSYEDHRKPGDSQVIEIPLGKAGGSSLYIDTTSLWGIGKAARALAKQSHKEAGDIVVSVLTHTYEFASCWKRFKIRLALFICKKYGEFISDQQALEITKERKD